MGMERIERCSKHDISEEKSAQNFQTSTSPNPVLPIEGPWYLKNFGMAVEETGSTKSSENKTAQDRSGHTHKLFTETSRLLKRKVDLQCGTCFFWSRAWRPQEGFNYYLFREESWLLKWKLWNCLVTIFAKKYVCRYPLIVWYQLGPQFELQTSRNETLSSQDDIFSYIQHVALNVPS